MDTNLAGEGRRGVIGKLARVRTALTQLRLLANNDRVCFLN